MSTRTHFVILFEGRTGSSFAISALNSHPHVIAAEEALMDKSAGQQHAWIQKFFRNPHHTERIRTRVRTALLPHTRPHIVAAGFKTKLRCIQDRDAFREQLHAYECKIIYLDRRNTIKLALSGLNALRLYSLTGRYNRLKGESPLPPFAPTIEELEAAIAARQEKSEALEAFLKTLKLPLLTLYYEDMLQDRQAFFDTLLAFINAEPRTLESRFSKNSSDDLRDVLTNYKEIRDYFSAKGYGGMFDEHIRR